MTKENITPEEMAEVHPMIPNAFTQLKEGKITRRDFIRFSTLLGMSAALATACSSPEPAAAPAEEEAMEEEAMEEEAMEEEAMEEEAMEEEAMGGITRGGTLTIGSQLQLLDHPARLSWLEGANVVRQFSEYLTYTDPDNITHPWLFDSWEANADVTEWTFTVRPGVTFSNGDALDRRRHHVQLQPMA